MNTADKLSRASYDLNSGRTSAAAAQFEAILEHAPNTPAAWHGLGVACGLLGDARKLFTFAEGVADEDRVTFVINVLNELLERDALDFLETLPEALRLDPLGTSLAIYYAGCAALVRGDNGRAFALFGRFRNMVLSDHQGFPIAAHEGYNLIFRQAALIEPPETVAELMARPPHSPHPGISPMRPIERGMDDVVLFSGCDGRYFARFIPDLAASIASMRPDLPLHIHVVCPTDDTAALARTLMERHPGLRLNVSTDDAPPWRHAEYFACDRFLVMPSLIEAYGAPILALDADSVLLTDLRQVVAACHAFDFACFTTGRREPASAFQATLMYFAATPASLRFLDIVGRLAHLKLNMPPVLIWLLDQASIFSAVHYVDCYEPLVRVGDLRRVTATGLRDHVAALGTQQEKQRIMNGSPASSAHAHAGIE